MENGVDLDHVRTVAVFGTGEYATDALELARRCGWQVRYLVDNNPGAWDKCLHGFAVRKPEAVVTEPVDLVIIASYAHADTIADQLRRMGLVEHADFISFLTPVHVGVLLMKVMR